ncbi:agamous-like MADS-box protein AGL11 isoform X3 [Punica granatum]|uniref:Agamous-like MADS-box protein AGL11 isoform X3 n=1 Tax=Punica granatum TaxID=22663 RepID=A0A6P8D185_PUNGR|nr:agamous-like MADS-box protein AGL11 isoform X3 [Punica granatum]
MLLAEIEYSQKKEIEMENETVYLCTKIAEIERMKHVNMVPGQEMNAIQVLASRNFFRPNMLEGGNSYSHPDKKLHLGTDNHGKGTPVAPRSFESQDRVDI